MKPSLRCSLLVLLCFGSAAASLAHAQNNTASPVSDPTQVNSAVRANSQVFSLGPVTLDKGPTIASVTSSAGKITSAVPGTTIQINGNGFGATQGSNFVCFCSSPTKIDGFFGSNSGIIITAWSNTQISLIVPADNTVPFGSYWIMVALWDGKIADKVAGQTNGFAFATQAPGPTISTLTGGVTGSAKTYQALPGAEINIYGVGFQDFTGCGAKGRAVLAQGTKVVLSSSNYAYISKGDPTGAAGVVELALGLPTTIAPGTYSFYLLDGSQHQSNVISLTLGTGGTGAGIVENGAHISSISPSPAWISPIEEIYLYGGGFAQGAVTFTPAGGGAAITLTQNVAWASNEVNFEPPSTLPPGSYLVTVSGACGMTSNAVPLVVSAHPAPAISAANTPGGGAPGTIVTLTGSNFGAQSGSYVSFKNNGVTWASPGAPGNPQPLQIGGWTDSFISFTLPVQPQPSSSTATVTVTTNGGASNPRSITVNPLWGFVDLHTHPLANLGFGGDLISGGVDVGSTITKGPNCESGPLTATSEAMALGPENSIHGGWGTDNTCGNDIRELAIHITQEAQTPPAYDPSDSTYPTSGYPGFVTWPIYSDLMRQKMWVEWMRRSYQNGQRVLVALAVNNPLLAELVQGDLAHDDKGSADLQIPAIIAFVNRHSDFMQVAYSSSDIPNILAANKMAVIVGVEIDNIGDYSLASPPPSIQQVQAEIDRLYAEGVRYVFPIHLVDNVFGGTAVYQDIFDMANLYEEGSFWNMTCSNPGDGINHAFSVPQEIVQELISLAILQPLTPPVPICLQAPGSSAPVGVVNSRGLSPLGAQAIQYMMSKHMLIDIDHMSQLSANAALSLAEAQPNGGYPVMSGHNGLRNPSSGGDSNERSLTALQYARIAKLHGMAGVGSANLSAPQWLQGYQNVVAAMGGGTVTAGFGTDTDGMAPGMPANATVPLPGSACPVGYKLTTIPGTNMGVCNSNVQYNSTFPMSTDGNQSWNYNLVGVAHYGMLPDFLKDVANLQGGAAVVNQFMYGAEYFWETWRRAEGLPAQ